MLSALEVGGQRQAKALERMTGLYEEQHPHTKGTLASIGRPEECLAFLARRCGTLNVVLAEGYHGKGLY